MFGQWRGSRAPPSPPSAISSDSWRTGRVPSKAWWARSWASAIILVHNHPSGDPTPSRADIDMTRQVIEGGRALGIALHDHLVVGAGGVASFKAPPAWAPCPAE